MGQSKTAAVFFGLLAAYRLFLIRTVGIFPMITTCCVRLVSRQRIYSTCHSTMACSNISHLCCLQRYKCQLLCSYSFKLCFPQPTRLNVFKNDQDTWDYTNPNLGGPGKTYKRIPEHLLRALHSWKFTSLILLSTLTATVRSFSRQASGKGTLFIDNAAA